MKEETVTLEHSVLKHKNEWMVKGKIVGKTFLLWRKESLDQWIIFIQDFCGRKPKEEGEDVQFLPLKNLENMISGIVSFFDFLDEDINNGEAAIKVRGLMLIHEVQRELQELDNTSSEEAINKAIHRGCKAVTKVIDAELTQSQQPHIGILKIMLMANLMKYAPEDIVQTFKERDPDEIPVSELFAVLKLYAPEEVVSNYEILEL